MRTLRHITLFLTLALLLLAISAVGAQDAGSGTLRVGTNAPVQLDPAQQSADSEIALNRAIYDYLVDVLPDSTIAPNLATSWTISDDGLTYTFMLADGVTFHDGKAFSSADVVFTFNRLKEVQSPALSLLGDFEIAAPDASTVVFTLKSANADFLYGVAASQAVILPDGQNTPNVIGEGDSAYANFNGTGPFKLQSFDAGSRAVLVRNDSYWKSGEPKLAELDFVYMDDPVAQVDALLSGQVDYIFKIPSDQVDRLEGNSAVSVIQKSTSQHAVIRLRTDPGSLGEDVRVRQALKYATDREALNETLLQGRGTVGNNDPIAPVFSNYFDSSIENQTYDPAKACELLTEAGKNPLETTLFTPDSLGYPDLATVLQQQWAATGCINVDVQVVKENLYYADNPDNWLTAQLGITGWGARPSPQLTLKVAYASDGAYNETQWKNADLDALIAQASTTTDDAARKEIYAQISQIFLTDGPVIIPYFAPLFGATSAGVQGLDMAPFPGLTDFRAVSISG